MIDSYAGSARRSDDDLGPWHNSVHRYGKVSITLHWAGALSILAMLGTAAATWFAADEEEAVGWLRLHGAIGIAAYLVIAARIAWHFREPQPRKLGRSSALNATATAVHATMLVLIGLQLLTGPLNVWSGGWGIDVFGAFEIPSPFGEQPWHDTMGLVHTWTGYAVAALVAVHLAAVAKHTFVDRDGTLQRMLGIARARPSTADE